LYNALILFEKDMEVLKLLPEEIINKAKDLMNKLQEQF